MGCCFSRDRGSNIEITDEIESRKDFDYLRPKGKLIYKIDSVYDVPKTDILFEGWYPNSVRLWPRDNKARRHFLMLERTPPVSPQISSFDDNESSTNTVH